MRAWIDESRELAESFTYSPEIRAAVQEHGEIAPIELPESYLREAGERARRRVVAAGLRLAVFVARGPTNERSKTAWSSHPLGFLCAESPRLYCEHEVRTRRLHV